MPSKTPKQTPLSFQEAGEETQEEHPETWPTLSEPQAEPNRHWATQDGRAINCIESGRRPPAGQAPVEAFAEEEDEGLFEADLGSEASLVTELRKEVSKWRSTNYRGAEAETRKLLQFWSSSREDGPRHPLFFAQREAIETVIWLTEINPDSDPFLSKLRELGEDWSHGILRLALRMATGTGKTAVMACLIAWMAATLGKAGRRTPKGLARNVDRVVVICPGKTIWKRLQELDPRNTDNIYDKWGLCPKGMHPRGSRLQVNIINWERLQPRSSEAFQDFETRSGGLPKGALIKLAGAEAVHKAKRTFAQVWDHLLGPSARKGRKKERIVVLNDEGHHCWLPKEDAKHKGANIWMNALLALDTHPRRRLMHAIDLTATPTFINPANTHRPRGARGLSLFPWIVSEFALVEAMESGLVKIPQVPRIPAGKNAPPPAEKELLTDAMRNLYDFVNPLGERNPPDLKNNPNGMKWVRKAVEMLHQDYRETFEQWKAEGATGHPVMIAVADTKKNAEAIFDMIAGGRKSPKDPLRKSRFDLLSNVPSDGADESDCTMRTILVVSGSSSSDNLKSDDLTEGRLGIHKVSSARAEAELREVLQTVAQPGKPGTEVRCVVSVKMLTEGWDCQRVTHILGYRRFASSLLCEQTMGRALRRSGYDSLTPTRHRTTGEVTRRYRPERSVVFGVPFSQVRGLGDEGGERPRPEPPVEHEIRPVPERAKEFRIEIPDIRAYTMSTPQGEITFDPGTCPTAMEILPPPPNGGSPVPPQGGEVDVSGIIGPQDSMHATKEDPELNAWTLAHEISQILQEDEKPVPRMNQTFVQVLSAVKKWISSAGADVPKVLTALERDDLRESAASSVLKGIRIQGVKPEKVGIPSDPASPLRCASTWRPFTTTLRDVVEVERSELDKAACHSKLEAFMAEALDRSPLVASFVRNHGPDRIEIPYRHGESWGRYVPDFLLRLSSPAGEPPEMVVLEGKGQPDSQSASKARWTKEWWIPCADRLSAGKWHFLEVGDHRLIEPELARILGKPETEDLVHINPQQGAS